MTATPIRLLNAEDSEFADELDRLLAWEAQAGGEIASTVADILAQVQQGGDAALVSYTAQLDKLEVDDMGALTLSADDLQQALSRLDSALRSSLQQAADRIREYHQRQLAPAWSYTDELGNELGQRVTPLDRVGVYVPGGQASYPTSVLMTLIPAQVAGVGELIVTFPTPGGVRNDTVLAALAVAGADKVFTVGGAQAIGALAYGTESVPRVDKIVGPGGAWVAEAKRQVFGRVGIDVIAGPSEVLIIADGTTDPEWAALDLFSQAEHDAAAQAILLSPDESFIGQVQQEIERLLPTMQRRDIIAGSLSTRGALIRTPDLGEAVRIANRIAPEHLELHVADVDALLPDIRHAGAVFCGAYAGETLGDYVAGPSHVLPTFGTARYASPLGVYDFQKRSSLIRISPEGAASLADTAVPLALSEGLQAHALAAAARARQS